MPSSDKWIRDVPEHLRPKLNDTPLFRLSDWFPWETVADALTYTAQDEDVFLSTYPKSGTHWTENILYQLQHDAQLPQSSWPENVIFFEKRGREAVEQVAQPRVIRTHLPASVIPWNEKTKYIAVIRNPKDVVVSYYHHTIGLDMNYKFKGTFNDYFNLFIGGQGEFGDWFDHVNLWLEKRHLENVFIVTYEEMKKDIGQVIEKLACFLGEKYEQKVKQDATFVDRIKCQSSFNSLKAKEDKFPAELTTQDYSMYRKGIVNDWKNVFSKEQNDQLTERFKEEAEKNPALLELWQDYSWLNDPINQ